MASQYNVFPIENRVDELFETVYPKVKRAPGVHPSGRNFEPVWENAIMGLVPGGNETRKLQSQREYFKLDFEDFIDHATSPLPQEPVLTDFQDQTAAFYDLLEANTDERKVHATWTYESSQYGISIMDAAVARDKCFVTVLMRFTGLIIDENEGKPEVGQIIKDEDGEIAECGVSIVFAPTNRNETTLAEWERALWWPPSSDDPQWRFSNSGEFTSSLLEQIDSEDNPPYSPESIAKMHGNAERNQSGHGVFFEIARLGLLLPRYIDFMYDLIVTEKRRVGTKTRSKRSGAKKRRKTISKPIYKIIQSIRIIRPNSSEHITRNVREWRAPSYRFAVQGHWRRLADPQRKGHDADGNVVHGRTWVRGYQKHKELNDKPEIQMRNPNVVIGVKQPLSFARDVIKSYKKEEACMKSHEEEDRPSAEWMACERAKLTAGLRYFILKRDNYRCRKCGRSASDENNVKLEVDHIIPVSQWGQTVEDNLQTLCRDCNKGKAGRIE